LNPVTLVIGVPGSGKSWVCERLAGEEWRYIRHDDHYNDQAEAIAIAARDGDRRLLADVPFGERTLRDRLVGYGLSVTPVFILESEEVIRARLTARDGAVREAWVTRLPGLVRRAADWGAFSGTAWEVLHHLRACQRG
jgi:predicted kinase